MEERTGTVLEALGVSQIRDPARAFEAAYRYCVDLGIEMRLSALGVPADDLGAMADEAHAIRRLLDNNPRELSRAPLRPALLAPQTPGTRRWPQQRCAV